MYIINCPDCGSKKIEEIEYGEFECECGEVFNLKTVRYEEEINMELKETIPMMESLDYKERFRAEYFQLEIRIKRLGNMLRKYKEGTLTFKPSCSYDLLDSQLKAMRLYHDYLEARVIIENIELDL